MNKITSVFTRLSLVLLSLFGVFSIYAETPDYYSSIVMIEDEDLNEAIAKMENLGIKILNTRENLVLCFIPYSLSSADLETLSNNSIKRNARFMPGRQKGKVTPPPSFNVPTMDVARTWYDAYKVADGQSAGLPQAFDGTGVVFGLCDTGFDPSHPSFLSLDGSECRIRQISYYDENDGSRHIYSSPEEIAGYVTDNVHNTHATHVANIGAGASRQFRGLAPGADIVFVGMRYLTDGCILAGVEDIIAYAKSVGKPAVINLSLGNYTGPHDGSSLVNRYLDLCGEDAIICLSSGNAGSGSVYYDHTFSSTSPSFEMRTTDWDGLNPYGQTEVWSKDTTPFKYQLMMFNNVKDIVYFDIVDFTKQDYWEINADIDSEWYNEKFAEIFSKESSVKVQGGINPLNGKFYISSFYEGHTDIYDGDNAWAKYMLGMKIYGEEGCHVDCYIDATKSFFRRAGNGPMPNSIRSISDLACGFNTISVGMSVNRSTMSNLNGDIISCADAEHPGAPDIYSSYGTLDDGRIMPETMAPGRHVISAISRPYVEYYLDPANTEAIDPSVIPSIMHGSETYDGKTYYYMSDGGTSMACPHVAGSIACWLQANPKLKVQDVKDIIAATNIHNYPLNDDPALKPKGGRGAFNLLGGLKKILGETLSIKVSGLESVAIEISNRKLTITNPVEKDLTISVYDINGRNIVTYQDPSLISEYNLDNLEKGVYVISVKDPEGNFKMLKAKI